MRFIKLLFILLVLMYSSLSFSQSTTLLPDTPPTMSSNDGDYELGVKFNSNQPFKITQIRYYKPSGEMGTHIGKIWDNYGNLLAEVTFTDEDPSLVEGWQYADVVPNLYLSPEVVYTVSVNNNYNYSFAQYAFDTPVTNGFLTVIADGNNGVFNENQSLFPTSSYRNSNYYRDIIAEPVNSLFTNQVPEQEFTDGASYEMGLKFTSSVIGKISAIKYYKASNETGSHTGRLWTSDGTLISSVNFVNESGTGWQYAFFNSPVLIQPNTVYVVSVNKNTGYAATPNGLTSSITNGYLSSVADGNNGVYSEPSGVFPTMSFNNGNYFRDVVFEPILPPSVPVLISPSNNGIDKSIEPLLEWTKSIGATSYTLQIATDINFNNVVFNQTNITSENYKVTGLLNLTKYYWRVKAEKQYASSEFSAPFNFTTIKAYNVALSWPIGGVQVYQNPVQMSWYLPQGGTGIIYDLFYSTIPANLTEGNCNAYYGLTNNKFSLAGLQPGTKYYWLIRTRNMAGAVTSYSSIESFVSLGVSLVPIPSYPVNAVTIYSYSPTLRWYLNDYSTGLTYDVEIREGNESSLTGIPTHTGLAVMNLPLSGLNKGTTYTWRVRSKSGSKYSNWSTAVTFNTVAGKLPLIPVASYPINNATVYSLSQKLFWYVNDVSEGLTYEVEYVSGTNTPFTGVPQVTGLTSLSYLMGNLLPNTTYKWRVRSTDGVTYSSWSNEGVFKTYNPPIITAVVPIPSWPINNCLVYTDSTILYWYLNTNGSGLTFDIDFGMSLDGVPEYSGLTVMNQKVIGLISGKTYQWRVRSFDGTNYSGWSNAQTFTTYSAPVLAVTPVPSWPIGGVIVFQKNQQLSWYMNAFSAGLTYNLQYGTDINNLTSIEGLTSTTYNLAGLIPGSVYFWRVRSFDGNVYSAFSAMQTFTTNAGLFPATPVIGSPSYGEVISINKPVLSWFLPVQSETASFQIEYSKNENMLNAVKLTNQTTSQSIEDLVNGETYYWRVRSLKEDGTGSAYSNKGCFTLSSATLIQNENQMPEAFELSQNYPNPFNPNTTIRFALKSEGKYSLRIYNILGQEVARLFDEFKNAGFYSVVFNASRFSSGVYFYTLVGENINISRSMILLK